MKVLKLRQFNNSKFNVAPWQWGVVNELISKEDAVKIRHEIDQFDFERVEADRRDKSYCMELFETDRITHTTATTLQNLMKDLNSAEYISTLEEYVQADLSSKEYTTNIWKYSTKDFLSPHLDKKEKYLTHLLYFNERWPQKYGGSLNILSNSDEDSVVMSVQPSYQNSVIIKTDETSWHSVSKVKVEGLNRYCMQVIFWDRI